MATKDLKEFEEHAKRVEQGLSEDEEAWKKGENREVEFQDRHPSVLSLAYGDLDTIHAFCDWMKKEKIKYRILLPIDICFPIFPTKKYNEQVNKFKHFTVEHSQRVLNALNSNMVIRGITNKMLSWGGYEMMSNMESWLPDTTHPFLALSLTPLLVQNQKHYKDLLKDQEHKDNWEKLKSFKSHGYERKDDALFGNKKPIEEELNNDGVQRFI